MYEVANSKVVRLRDVSAPSGGPYELSSETQKVLGRREGCKGQGKGWALSLLSVQPLVCLPYPLAWARHLTKVSLYSMFVLAIDFLSNSSLGWGVPAHFEELTQKLLDHIAE